jgi:hypothetical protein
MAESELVGLHLGLGLDSEQPGAVVGNRRCWNRHGAPNADDASMVIIEAVWRRLREMVPKVH